MNACMFAPATMKSICITSFTSNLMAVGHLFGPDQNGAPDEVNWWERYGNINNKWLNRLAHWVVLSVRPWKLSYFMFWNIRLIEYFSTQFIIIKLMIIHDLWRSTGKRVFRNVCCQNWSNSVPEIWCERSEAIFNVQNTYFQRIFSIRNFFQAGKNHTNKNTSWEINLSSVLHNKIYKHLTI